MINGGNREEVIVKYACLMKIECLISALLNHASNKLDSISMRLFILKMQDESL